MQTLPINWKFDTRESTQHYIEPKLVIGSAEYGIDKLHDMQTSIAPFGDETPKIGQAVAAEIDVTLEANSADIPRMAEIKPYVRGKRDAERQYNYTSYNLIPIDNFDRESEEHYGVTITWGKEYGSIEINGTYTGTGIYRYIPLLPELELEHPPTNNQYVFAAYGGDDVPTTLLYAHVQKAGSAYQLYYPLSNVSTLYAFNDSGAYAKDTEHKQYYTQKKADDIANFDTVCLMLRLAEGDSFDHLTIYPYIGNYDIATINNPAGAWNLVINDINKSGRYTDWLQKGVFYVDTREIDQATGLITLHGYDAMLKAERDYPSSNLTWPSKDITVVNEIAQTMGISVDPRTTALMTAGFSVPFPAQYTMREVLSNIAAKYGGSFIISDVGALRLVCIWDVKDEADQLYRGWTYTDRPPQAMSATDIPAYDECTGIRFIVNDNTEVFVGESTGYVFEIDCPWANATEAEWLLNKMSGFVYRPYEMDGCIIDPAVEVGDTVVNAIETVSGSSNILPLQVSEKTISGVTITFHNDGTFELHGTASSRVYTTIYSQPLEISGETFFTMIGVPDDFPEYSSGQSQTIPYFTCTIGESIAGYAAKSEVVGGMKYLYTNARSNDISKFSIVVNVPEGYTIDGTFYPQVLLGSDLKAWQPPDGVSSIRLSGVWSYNQIFSTLSSASIGAPRDNDIDHEYPFVSRAEREYKRKQKDIEAELYLMSDSLKSVVQEIEYTVTESDNLLTFPLYHHESFTENGVTFTYREDGSIKVEGTCTTTLQYVPITFRNTFSSLLHVISVKTDIDYPTDRYPFCAYITISTGNTYAYTLSNSTSEDETTKTFYYSLYNSPGIQICASIYAGVTYDYVVYPQIVDGAELKSWTEPVGALANHFDKLSSEILQLVDQITLKVSKGDVSSQISVESGAVSIGSNRLTIDSTNFKVSGSGEVEATGKLTTTSGSKKTIVDAGEIEMVYGSSDVCAIQPYSYSYRHERTGVTMGPYSLGRIKTDMTGGLLFSTPIVNMFMHGQSGQAVTTRSDVLNINGITYCPWIVAKTVELFSASDYNSITSIERNNSGIIIDDSLTVEGSLYVSGSKPRIVNTEHYGTVALNAMESTYCVFSDLGSGVIDETGHCYVFIDPDFAETIDRKHEYLVFTTQTSEGRISRVEKAQDYFVVHGTAGTGFDWLMYARQRDYEADRLERVDYAPDPDKKELKSMPDVLNDENQAAQITEEYMEELLVDYDAMAEEYMEEYEREVEEVA